MNAVERVARDNAPAERGGPQLRTLLLTDLVDSTALVERLGDTAAAELFRAHDRLVLGLQQHWRGRLIDRSDGMLLLFERPIDGLGFALDYTRGLLELGAPHNVELKARAGLHVGEVLTWRNSDDAVRVGAKPVEVEGLAKPMAGRLMTTALPGQILISAVAEPLAHRAARELGERGQHLLWKSHGRWRFKGVPEAQQIFEVGEPGVAPLRTPPNTNKAWRDIPLWRRPAALATEVALLAVIALGGWFIARPQPAIAFNERDWVVLADLRNLTDQPLLDDSLEQAFRISLEQSRHVNVLSDLKTRDTLARMQRAPGTELDRAIASEIAIRDGARAVILPTVAEVGGRVRVSAEVIDPNSQTTVYAEYADGKGAVSALASIDEVTAALREKLGEALAAVEQDSAPLPQVSTENLDALRAYALGQKAYGQAQMDKALRFYQRATQLDPQFALAWLGQMRVQFSEQNAPAAVPALRQAQALREHLAPREAMYLDAWAAEFDAPSKALGKWQELASLYPDYWPALGNTANALAWQSKFEDALPFALRSTALQNELSAISHDLVGRIHLGMEQYSLAAEAFDQALRMQFFSSARRRAGVEAAQRHFVPAQRMMSEINQDRYAYLERISMAIDQARWSEARSASQAALRETDAEDSFFARALLMPAATADWLSGNESRAKDSARAAAAGALSFLAADYDADAIDDAGLALSAALFSQRLGDSSLTQEVLAKLGEHDEVMEFPSLVELAAVVRAERARIAGHPAEALKILEPLVTGHERYQTRVALLEAYAATGQLSSVLEQVRWLQQHRGLAYIEQGCGQCLQALNVADSNLATLRAAEILAANGRTRDALRELKSFDRFWPVETLPTYLRVRRSAVIAASN
ncbi:putative peptide modification system cyclase [Lysobacter zhanggongensis]|uniref:Peptide modification system cyclase n=1 Tax=Lysobacter zhanggongensis TaxID=1774951 RepID=A0ABU7YSM4_9GAMM